jgi:hypothetical protein
MRRTHRVAAVLLVTALVGSCSGSADFREPTPTGSAPPPGSSAPTPSATAPATGCPARYADPDPNRPRITLTFDVSPDLGTVTGTERVRFVPDRPVREVVFRLTPNGPTSFPDGTSLTVQRATADPGGQRFRYEVAGAAAGSPGGALVIPLGREVPAGQPVTADLAFTLRLGSGSFERFGRSGRLAWFGSGQPLFAWERGVGWHREALAKWIGESATSEAADIDLTVTAPGWATVLASGVQDPPADAGGDRRRWHAVAPTARDVAVSVGELSTADAAVAGTRLTVGASERGSATAEMAQLKRAVGELARRYGPFPFPALNVTLLPGQGGGIEYPGAILLFGSSQLVETHETAHQWFYAMVGNSQSRDPWLDEAFASFAEQLVDGAGGGPSGPGGPPPSGGDVGAGINEFPNMEAYFGTVYGTGAQALHQARKAAGPARFDAALRCYVNANAWRIARPADVAAALHDLPAALAVLRKVHALP